MSTVHALPAAPPAVVRAAQLGLGLMSAVVTFGSIFFSVIDPPQEVHGVDWLVAAWALAMGLAGLVVATRLARGEARVRRLAVRLLGLHFAFGVVKLAGYGEQEALTFMAVDALLLALLAAPPARRWFS